jgi:hypothetical protein
VLDYSIQLHKKLTEILENFTNDLYADLDELSQKVAKNGREVDSYFEKMSSRVEHWTSKVQISFESVSVDIEVSPTFQNYRKISVDQKGNRQSNLP